MDTKTRLLIEALGARDLTIINLQAEIEALRKQVEQLPKDNEGGMPPVEDPRAKLRRRTEQQ